MVLDKEGLFAEMQPETELVSLKSGDVIVSDIGAEASMRLWTDPALQGADGETDMVKFTVALVALAVVDESGNRLFDNSDIERLSKSAKVPFGKLAAAAKRLNGLTGEEVKNSEETDSADSSSVSVSTSGTATRTSSSKSSPRAK